MSQFRGEKILITGATGQVAKPLAKSLAVDNEVWAIARFGNQEIRADLERAGIHTVVVDIGLGHFSGVPEDVTYGLHFARASAGEWNADLDVNVGGVLYLMEFCRNAKAFLHCSSTAVYQPKGSTPRFAETDPLGDNHRAMSAYAPDIETYSITKIAAEGAARWAARRFNLPTTIARLNVPYGSTEWSWPASHLDMMIARQPVPVYLGGRTEYNPIHDDDILDMLPRMLEIASVPPIVVNWGGHEVVSIEEWCAYFAELTGVEPTLLETTATIESVSIETTQMQKLVGTPSVRWKDGFRRIVEAQHPELLKP